jgi:hypothetical protein
MVKSSSRGRKNGDGVQPRSRVDGRVVDQWRFAASGTVVGLQSSRADVLERAAVRLRWLGWTPARDREIDADVDYELRIVPPDAAIPASDAYELRCDGSFVHCSTDIGEVLDAFEDHAKLLTAERAEGCLFVHAGAVAWRDCGIVIPGRSRSGKTTLVRALVDAGATYYSDEFAVLDPHGWVHPFALPLSIRASDTQPALRTRVEVIAGRRGTRPVPVRLIVVTSYRRYARWRPRLLSHGQAFLALMENTVAARRAPATAMAVLRPTALRARTIETIRGNARSVAAAVLAEADDLG